MEALKTLHQHEQYFYENDNDYDNLEILDASKEADWQEDRITLGLNQQDLKELPTWIENQKKTFQIGNETGAGQLPKFQNAKQRVAFAIIRQHIEKAKTCSVHDLPQLLLNILGGAGTGKTFWLNAVCQYAAENISAEIIKCFSHCGRNLAQPPLSAPLQLQAGAARRQKAAGLAEKIPECWSAHH
jgi:DNA replication protein DnaC